MFDKKSYAKEYYIKNKDKILNRCKNINKDIIKERHKKYYDNNKEKINSRIRKYKENNKEKYIQYYKDRKSSLKMEIIKEYGGRCNCCGNKFDLLLTIDHKNGGGQKHRKSINNNMYSWLKKNNFPKNEYELLCFNCNCAKGFFGCCPHNIEIFNKYNTMSTTYNAIRNRKIKKLIIDHYGGVCECCGVNNIYFLTIHHVNNDGGKHRKNINNANIYMWIKRNNFPEGMFKVLCYNCNCSIGAFGYCPHQKDFAGVISNEQLY